jgi:4-carboxymuconolactone decarboxylase
MDKEMFERGMQLRREMTGEEQANKEWAGADDFDRPLQELVTTYCFGEVWGREPLSRKTRSMLTVAMLIAINRQGPLKMHYKNALNNGVTKDEIREIILHSAIYCGVAAANEATRVAKEAFSEVGLD